MDVEKFTDRARGFVQSAQSLATREGNQQFTSLHLLKVLLDDGEGLVSGLVERAGGSTRMLLSVTETELAKLPKVTGGSGQVYLASEAARLLSAAEKLAQKAGDSFVTVERLFQAMLEDKQSDAGKILVRSGLDAALLAAAIDKLRKGRTADSVSAENAYDALKKYARDLTRAARDGKLDPVIGRDEEIRRTIQVFSRRTKNNPVLIGEPGVGKTAIVEGLALRILFHRLQKSDMGKIVDIQFARLARLLEERKIEIVLEDAGRDWLAEKGWDPAYGACPLKRAIQRYVQDPLAEMILGGDVRDGSTVRISAAGGDLTFNGRKPEFVDEDEFGMA